MSPRVLMLSVVVLFLSVGCGGGTRTVRVAVPPRVDLRPYPMVGLVTFASNAKGDLDRLAAQKFLQALQDAQPGTSVIELGSEQQVLASVNGRTWDPATLRAIKATHGVDVLVMGRLDVEKAKPEFQLSTIMKQLSVRQDVNASLNTKLVETATGATRWTDAAALTANVANARFNDRGQGHFGATDPEAAYGEMLNGLVWHVTDDFRTHYVTRRVPREQKTAVATAND